MRSLIDRYRPYFNTESGSAAAGAAAAPGSSDAPAAGAGAAAKPGEGGASPTAAAAAAAPVAPYRPEGLPDNLYGKTDQETIDNLKKVADGYRTRDAERQVPDDPAAYKAFDLEKVAPEIKPHIEALANDPLFDKVAGKAKELGISVPALHALTAELYGSAQAGGIFADMVDPVAERQALIPAGFENKPQAEQDAAIDARVKANEDFVNLLVKNSTGADGKPLPGGLTKEVADNAVFMLGCDAKGNQFLEYVRSLTTAGGAQPFAGGGSGAGDTRETLRAEMAKPEMQPGHPKFSREAYDALDLRYQKLFSNK